MDVEEEMNVAPDCAVVLSMLRKIIHIMLFLSRMALALCRADRLHRGAST